MVELPGLGNSGKPTLSGFELAIELDGSGSLPIDTTARGIDSSSTGLQSTTEWSLIRACGCKKALF
eukprot:6183420-Pleurochrysis_carterae.AAC.2